MLAGTVYRIATFPQPASAVEGQTVAPHTWDLAFHDENLTDHERVVLHALLDQRGRVVARTQLAQAVGLRRDQRRRIDAYLVSVRRCLQQSGLDVVNVRSRGWMIP